MRQYCASQVRFFAGEPLDPAIREHVTLLTTLEKHLQPDSGSARHSGFRKACSSLGCILSDTVTDRGDEQRFQRAVRKGRSVKRK